jgi:hypothetical protein
MRNHTRLTKQQQVRPPDSSNWHILPNTNRKRHLRQQHSLDVHVPLLEVYSDRWHHVQDNRHGTEHWVCPKPNRADSEGRCCSYCLQAYRSGSGSFRFEQSKECSVQHMEELGQARCRSAFRCVSLFTQDQSDSAL